MQHLKSFSALCVARDKNFVDGGGNLLQVMVFWTLAATSQEVLNSIFNKKGIV